MNFREDDDAIAWIPAILATGALFAAFGWSTQQVGNTSDQIADLAEVAGALIIGSVVMLLGAFLVGLSAWRGTGRFVPLGIVLLYAGLPFLGVDAAALAGMWS